jgi:predicted HicB family RNase H-like nuclease
MARPKLPRGAHRVKLTITVSPEARRLLAQLARRAKTSASQLVDELVRREADRVEQG